MQSSLEGVEGFLLCSHCKGEGYCRADGESGGCDFCREEQTVVHVECQPENQLSQVICGFCGGKGYFGTPTPMIGEPEHRLHLGLFRMVTAFILTGMIAMVVSFLIVEVVRANAKNRIGSGYTDEAMRFDSYITLHADQTMTVEETVILKSRQQKKFLIERVYPAYKASFLKQNNAKIHLKEVYLDGQPLKFQMRMKGNAFIVRASQKTITPALHTYALIYDMPLPVHQNHGETAFRWVVDGRTWGFPAKQATLAVALPPHIDKQSVDVAGSVGPAFWFKRECIKTIDDSGNINFNAGQRMSKLDQINCKVIW
jgi:hypothetical protein